MEKLYRFCGSLKLAVFIITSLAATLIFATFFEASHGTKAVQSLVYRSWWFAALLMLLGVNIFCSAAQRYPWKPRQAGFVVAHLGILMVLFGSAVTRRFGIDGTMPLMQGETSNLITIDEPQFEIWDTTATRWVARLDVDPQSLRPSAEKPFATGGGIRAFALDVIPKSEARTEFAAAGAKAGPALEVEIASTATGIRQSQWLKAGDPQWGRVTMGLAEVSFAAGDAKGASPHGHGKNPHGAGNGVNPNQLHFLWKKDGTIRYRLSSRNRGASTGVAKVGEEVETGWRDFKFRVLKVLPHAEARMAYDVSPRAGDPNADLPPALRIRLATAGQKTEAHWLGYGEASEVELEGRKYLVRFGPRMISAPFALRLDRFDIGHYPGTGRAMTYKSEVTLRDPSLPKERPEPITMNEPLTHKGFTFYQASYQETPQGYVSVLSVGKDPGRTAKYLGSILLVLGIIIMYTYKFFTNRRKVTTS